MTKLFERRGRVIIMDRSNPHDFEGICEMCSKFDDLRPFGPKHENICFDCAIKDKETTNKRIAEFMNSQQ